MSVRCLCVDQCVSEMSVCGSVRCLCGSVRCLCVDQCVSQMSVCGIMYPLHRQSLCLFTGCLAPQQHASVSQGQTDSDDSLCCHTEIEVADQTCCLTQSQYADTGPTG